MRTVQTWLVAIWLIGAIWCGVVAGEDRKLPETPDAIETVLLTASLWPIAVAYQTARDWKE